MKKLYCVNQTKLDPNDVMRPQKKGSSLTSNAQKLEGILERHRPFEKLCRGESLVLFEAPESFNKCDSVPHGLLHTVKNEPVFLRNRSDFNWVFLLEKSILDGSGEQLTDSEINHIATNYWNGTPYHNDLPCWEYRTESAVVIEVEQSVDYYLNECHIEGSYSRENTKEVKIERLKYAKIFLESELAIEKIENDIASGKASLRDAIVMNNEFTISLIAQRMRIKQAGGQIINRSLVMDNLKISGDPQIQAKRIRDFLDAFYPNSSIIKVVPGKDQRGESCELYLLASDTCIHPLVASVNLMLETDSSVVSCNFVKMNEKNQFVAGIENKYMALSLINSHITKLRNNNQPPELIK